MSHFYFSINVRIVWFSYIVTDVVVTRCDFSALAGVLLL